ncbi:MAG: serine hydrolase, partial [Acidobacteria bacterium]|nr:serine hydrolase [Acidobacteriota bacterium]
RYALGQPLQFDPGTKYGYSNFGYAVLGRIIERVTGMSYEQYVRTNVLAPMGISGMRIGQTLPQGQQPNEVKYYPLDPAPSVFPDSPANATWPYGGWYMESMDAHGGWIASAIDYARFVNAIDGRRGTAFLSRSSVAALTAKPAGVQDWVGQPDWYGFGVMVRPSGNDANWWHSGLLDGTLTYQIRSYDGNQYVVFLNYSPYGKAQDNLFTTLDNGYWNAVGQVSSWPAGDQFTTNYPDSTAAVTAPAITTREGVVNGATFDRGVVAGSWITLFGINLSNSTRTWGAADIVKGALPLSLDGVSVKVDGKPAAVYYISPTQLNVQAPAGLTPGWVTVEATNNGASTGTVLTHVVSNAPGALTFSQNGVRYAVATNARYQVLAGGLTAAPGDTITIYASGLAPSPAGTVLNAPVTTPGVSATIGGMTAAVRFAGVISPGLFQVNVVVPNVGSGDQPLVITVNGASSPPGVFVPVGR